VETVDSKGQCNRSLTVAARKGCGPQSVFVIIDGQQAHRDSLEDACSSVGERQVQRKKGTDSEFRREAFVFWVASGGGIHVSPHFSPAATAASSSLMPADKIELVAAPVLDLLLDNLRRDFDAVCQQTARRARAEQLQQINQLVRRFRAYQSESDWVQATLDAAARYSNYVAVFFIAGDMLTLRGESSAVLPEGLSFPVAAAFASAIESKDPVTAMRTASEVTEALSKPGERAHLFPISNGDRVSAILFASDSGSDMNGLELVAGIASSMLERKANAALHAQIAAAPPPPATAETKPLTETKLPAWTDLPAEQRQLHIRAQRFARVAVAEFQLARPEACRAGREQNDLYLFLKREIDKARENYRKQFMTVPYMVDYFHLELIQTAAQGDERKLGADYPGRLQ